MHSFQGVTGELQENHPQSLEFWGAGCFKHCRVFGLAAIFGPPCPPPPPERKDDHSSMGCLLCTAFISLQLQFSPLPIWMRMSQNKICPRMPAQFPFFWSILKSPASVCRPRSSCFSLLVVYVKEGFEKEWDLDSFLCFFRLRKWRNAMAIIINIINIRNPKPTRWRLGSSWTRAAIPILFGFLVVEHPENLVETFNRLKMPLKPDWKWTSPTSDYWLCVVMCRYVWLCVVIWGYMSSITSPRYKLMTVKCPWNLKKMCRLHHPSQNLSPSSLFMMDFPSPKTPEKFAKAQGDPRCHGLGVGKPRSPQMWGGQLLHKLGMIRVYLRLIQISVGIQNCVHRLQNYFVTLQMIEGYSFVSTGFWIC